MKLKLGQNKLALAKQSSALETEALITTTNRNTSSASVDVLHVDIEKYVTK